MATINLDSSFVAATDRPAPPATSLKGKVTRVALVILTAAIIGAGVFLISSSLPISLAAGAITLLLLCVGAYYLNRSATPPVEPLPQQRQVIPPGGQVPPSAIPPIETVPQPSVAKTPLPKPAIPTVILARASLAPAVLNWQKRVAQHIQAAKENCTAAQVKAFRELLGEKDMAAYINAPLENVDTKPTPLIYLARTGPHQFVAVMADFGVDFRIKEPEASTFENTALHWAVANGENSTAWEIMKYAPRETFNMQCRHGNTPLHLTIAKGYTDRTFSGKCIPAGRSNFALTQALIAKGANVNIPGRSRNTPLHLACVRRDTATMKLLIDNGARIDKRARQLIDCTHEQARRLLTDAAGWEKAFLLPQDEFNNEKNRQAAIALLSKAGASS